MSSTRARKERNVQDRVSESLTEGDKQLIADLKRFSDDSGSESGNAGESVNNSPTSPAGNYLARKGDAMIGAFALSPPLDFTIDINSDNTINISPLNDNNQYSSNIQLEDVPTSTTLDIIAGATFDGQILILRTFAPNPITISQATLSNGGNIQTPGGTDVILGDLQMIVFVFDEALKIEENTGGTWRLLNTFGTGGDVTTGSVATLGLSSSVDLLPTVPVDFNNNTILGLGIIDRTDDTSGVFQLSGGIFQINSSISISQTDPQIGAGAAEWKRADNVSMTSSTDVGTKSRVYNSKSNANFSSTPVDAFTIDATTQDVFVQLNITSSTGSNPQLEKIGTWAQIFSIGGGTNGGGGGDISFPIRPPVTTGLPTTGNVVLDLDQTSGHYFTIGPLTGDIDIGIINPPDADIAQAFRINIIKGATDFAVTFNDTLLVQPFIGDENTTTLLAGDIYDGAVFNIFTMTSTAGSGTPTEQWANFPAVNDIDYATFDGINIDRLRFVTDSGGVAFNDDPSILLDGNSNMLFNVAEQREFIWAASNQIIMRLDEDGVNNDTRLTIQTSELDASAVPQLLLNRIDPTPTNDTNISLIQFQGSNAAVSGGVKIDPHLYAEIKVEYENVVQGGEASSIAFITSFDTGATTQFKPFMIINSANDERIRMVEDVEIVQDIMLQAGSNTSKLFFDGGVDTYFTGSDTSGEIQFFSDGTQKFALGTIGLALFTDMFLQMDERAADPAAGTTTETGKYYVKTVGGIAKPFFIGDGQVAVDLSAGGGIQSSIIDSNSSLTISDTEPQLRLSLNAIQDWLWQEDILFVRSNTSNYITQYFRNTGVGSNGQILTVVQYKGNDTLNNSEIFVTESTAIKTATNALEDGQYNMNVISKGTDSSAYLLEGGAGLINTNILHSFFGSMVLKSDQTEEQAIFRMERNDSSTMDDDTIGSIQFRAEDSTNEDTTYGSMGMEIADNSNTSEDGRFFVILQNGAANLRVIEADMLTNTIRLIPVTNFEYDFSNIGFEVRRITATATQTAVISLLKEDTGSSAGDNIGEINFTVFDDPTTTEYARILSTIKNQNDAGSIQFDVRVDDVSGVNALTIEGSPNTTDRTFVSLNAESRIGSDLKFQAPTGSTDLKIFPALNQLGIVVQDNVTFIVGSLGTNAIPATIIINGEITSDTQADGLFGDHEGAMGIVKNSVVTNAKLWAKIDGGWQFVEMTDAF